MSVVIVVKLPDADPAEARDAGPAVKAALAALGVVEVFTLDEATFRAHWWPLDSKEPHQPATLRSSPASTTAMLETARGPA